MKNLKMFVTIFTVTAVGTFMISHFLTMLNFYGVDFHAWARFYAYVWEYYIIK